MPAFDETAAPPNVEVLPVEDLGDPRVAEYRSMRRVARLREDRCFVAEGARVVRQLLESRLGVRSLLLDRRWLDELGPLLAARPEPRIAAYLTTRPRLEEIVGFHVHQGVMAIAEAPAPPDFSAFVAERPDALLVALEGVSNAENVGGILRTMAGLGADGLIIDRATNDPFVRRAVRVSMGAAFRIPVWRSEDLAATLTDLRAAHGLRSLALHVRGDTVPIGAADMTRPVCLVLGSEATGLGDAVVAACDACVEIPMHGGWSCLNVGTAGAIALWELHRRGGSAGSPDGEPTVDQPG